MIDPAPLSSLPRQSLDFDTSYRNVIDVQFVSRALAAEARCVRGARWATRTLYSGDAPEVIATAYYEYNRSFEALALDEGVLAHLVRQGDTVTVRLAGSDYETLDRAEERLREQLPEPESGSTHRVTVEFAYWQRIGGVGLTTRAVEAPTLDEL